MEEKKYSEAPVHSDLVSEALLKGFYPLIFKDDEEENSRDLRVLSLFSGCGGMDLGFEGHFIANKNSFAPNDNRIEEALNDDWLILKKTRFKTVFANDILPEAEIAWTTYMSRFGYSPFIYHCQSIVELVKMQKKGVDIFPKNIDVVTGGFPCQVALFIFHASNRRIGRF